jgi:uncharacterized protein YndB with AHSA1/START domain
MKGAGDYAKQIHISAYPGRVFDALTAAADFAAWWAPAAGSAAEGGELRLTFAGIEDPLVLQVERAKRPSTVTWNVRECSFPCVAVDSSAAQASRG